MPITPQSDTQIRIRELTNRESRSFDLKPDAAERERIAADLELLSLRKLRFKGRFMPDDGANWRLEAVLGATVTQPCIVTLAPVNTRIDTPVTRRFLADMPEPQPGQDEVEMPEDDTIEPLQAEIDLTAVMTEALALALPDYPRKEDAALAETEFTPPGAAPIREEEKNPFAALDALRDKLKKDE